MMGTVKYPAEGVVDNDPVAFCGFPLLGIAYVTIT
jgi:hypothetical protein